MNINSAYPSKYLAAASDFPDDADLILTIKDVTVENVGQGADAEDKPIIYFQEVKKGLLCNRTNSKTIANLYGAETDAWVGKKIAIYPTEVEYRGEMVLGIRVRLKAPVTKPVNKLWDRWNTLTKEAAEFGVPVPNLDPAASDEDVTKAGKFLANLINEARNKAAAF